MGEQVTTNLLEKLDPAVIRDGRFDAKIEITPPDSAARRAIMLAAISAPAYCGVSFADAALNQAVDRWVGFSAVRIRKVAQDAAKKVLKEGRETIEFTDLQRVLQVRQGKAAMPENVLSLSELYLNPDLALALKGYCAIMRHPEKMEAMSAALPSGILFNGPGGTGKTSTALALAKDSGWNFLDVSGTELLRDVKKIDSLVQDARDLRPTVVFIDEAKEILSDRRVSQYPAVTDALLRAIDDGKGLNKDILWIAAINNTEALDSAMMRAGRFTEKFEFSAPATSVLRKWLEDWRKNNAKINFAEDITLDDIGGLMEGQTIANTKAILQTAINNMVFRGEDQSGNLPTVTLDDMKRAKETIGKFSEL